MWNDLENMKAVPVFWIALAFLLPILLIAVAIACLFFLLVIAVLSCLWDALKKIFKTYL
jgi:hypothetical protein